MSTISKLATLTAATIRVQRSSCARTRTAVNHRLLAALAFTVTMIITSAPLCSASAFVGQNNFYEVDLSTGAGVLIGPNPSYTAFDFMPSTANLYGVVPIGGVDYSLAALSPSTNSYTLVGPTFSLGGQVPSEMTFDNTGNIAFVIDPLGRIVKIDLVTMTVTTIRDIGVAGCNTFGQLSCDGIAWLAGRLVQVGLAPGGSTAVRYWTIDSVTGAVVSFQDGVLPQGSGDYKGAWLDASNGTLYLGVEDASGRLGFKNSVSFGTADPTTGVFTKLSDNQLPAGQFARGIAIVETATPEPASLALGCLGFALVLAARLRTR